MRGKGWLVLGIVYIVMYACNAWMPMALGDDYVYSFIWDGSNGWNMYEPLPDTARRVTSFSDLAVSQWSHYFTWGGRTVAHTLVQFFLWQGKAVFNVLNAGAFVLLILEIYWLSLGGQLTLKLRAGRASWIFFALWSFTAGFPTVNLWLTGACNYLWMMVLLLGFLLPYVRSYLMGAGTAVPPAWLLFSWGLLAGWTNENTVCWVLLVLGCFLWQRYRQGEASGALLAGFFGLALGYALLMLAPGNQLRHAYELGMGLAEGAALWKADGKTFLQAVIFQLLLWFFLLSTLRRRRAFGDAVWVQRWLRLIWVLAAAGAGSMAIMLLAPEFPVRSAYPGTVLLIAASALLLELQQRTQCNLMDAAASRFLHAAAILYLVVTIPFSLGNSYSLWQQNQANMLRIEEAVSAIGPARPEKIILEPYEIKDTWLMLDGWHVAYSKSETAEWITHSFSLYYGLPDIGWHSQNP